ncbi:MAG TPA: phosphatidylglycerophosphatase A [Candidatus Acidoferrales bacterium]|nr:phosphatidylglycerophosphatase A [Candidatus Acidoferrales bacterium]
MNTQSDSAAATPARKPRLSFFLATAAGAGYLPAAPGTWGSLAGILVYAIFSYPLTKLRTGDVFGLSWPTYYVHSPLIFVGGVLAILIAAIGVIASSRVARFVSRKDPQIVVIDEVSGQFLTYLLALAPLNWKYLLLGFILFRGFDTWKPFPARQAESLPSGWGIMADDWMAGVYAAIGLWIARAIGL